MDDLFRWLAGNYQPAHGMTNGGLTVALIGIAVLSWVCGLVVGYRWRAA